MAEPSNIRINPFTGTGGATNYVELTEKHIIPANSPYVIRLNEVPEKQDPSNMKMVYVDSATGATTENALTEVAATPGQGEFRPDYSTNALEDKTWNTGLIEFSASDAGKIVQVTYTGTGTLADVTSNHWPSWYTDRGDGSDGDFVPTENTTISGVKNYKSVFIKAEITVTIDKYVLIKCQGAFVNSGTLTANGKGAAGGASVYVNRENFARDGYNGGDGVVSTGGAGGTCNTSGSENYKGYGGAGGGRMYRNLSVTEDVIKNIIKNDCDLYYGAGGGSGGSYGSKSGVGGAGGGCIIIISESFNNTGTLSSNGNNGGNGTNNGDSSAGGGGGGGCIVVICNTLVKQGTITAKGGSAGSTGSYNTAGQSGSAGITYIKALGV